MASVAAKTLGQSVMEVTSGPYTVASTTLKVETRDRVELQNLTQHVRDFVGASGIRAGQVIVASLHTTCAVFLNEWQDALLVDIQTHMESLISRGGYYKHNDPEWSDCDRNNADSHLRALVLGTQVALPVADGDVVLGEWQSIILGEFDGPRERTINIQVMGAATAE